MDNHLEAHDCENTSKKAYKRHAVDMEYVAWFGRCVRTESDTVKYTMPGVRFGVIFTGSRYLRVRMCGGSNFFQIKLFKVCKDQLELIRSSTLNSTYETEWCEVVSDLQPELIYQVVVIKKTEPELKSVMSNFSPVEVAAVRLEHKGRFQTVNAERMFYPNGWVEIIGDSDACGFGVDGEISHPSNIFTMDPSMEDVEYAWGTIVSELLGFGCVTIAWSGKGIVQNAPMCGADCLPAIWKEQSRTFAPLPKPKLVVILAGGNDFFGSHYPSKQCFVDGFSEFLRELRKLHGDDVPIVVFSCSSNCVSSSGSPSMPPWEDLATSTSCLLLSEYIDATINTFGGKTIFNAIIDTSLIIEDDYGIMMHWNKKGQQKVAQAMANIIADILVLET